MIGWSPRWIVTLLGVGLVILCVNDNSIARDCTCKNIGSGICIPDSDCLYGYIAKGSGTLEKATRDIGKASEKGAQDTGKAIKTIEKTPRETIEKTLKDVVKEGEITHITILNTGYSQLPELGKEEAGYGLYSYAVLTSDSDRSAVFLKEILQSIAAIEDTPGQRSQLNIFYIPIKKDKVNEFVESVKTLEKKPEDLGIKYSGSYYDYRTSRAILNHICVSPAAAIREVCLGDMSRGPYIFTYAAPASSLEPVPPPFLFVDLSDVDKRAYGEFVLAFRAQVKRQDISDGAKINTLRLRVLSIVLKAGDFIGPVGKSIADYIHSDVSKPGSK